MKQSSVNFQHESILSRRIYSIIVNNKNNIDIRNIFCFPRNTILNSIFRNIEQKKRCMIYFVLLA